MYGVSQVRWTLWFPAHAMTFVGETRAQRKRGEFAGKVHYMDVAATVLRALDGGDFVGAVRLHVPDGGETVVREDVTIVSPLNLPATMPEHASQLYARNVQALLELFVSDEGKLELNWDDEIISGACIVREGEIVNPGARAAVEAAAA